MKWAIIDFFQVYNSKKRMENKFKMMFRKDVSSVEPDVYSKRFLEFLREHLILKGKEAQSK